MIFHLCECAEMLDGQTQQLYAIFIFGLGITDVDNMYGPRQSS